MIPDSVVLSFQVAKAGLSRTSTLLTMLFLMSLLSPFIPAQAGTLVGGSTLLDADDLTQIETWLGQTGLTFTNIFSADTSDGKTQADFHTAADGVGRTLTVCQVTSPITAVMGGYNPGSWNDDGNYVSTPALSDRTAFIFNLSSVAKQNQRTDSNGGVQTLNSTTGPTWGAGNDFGIDPGLHTGGAYPYSYGTGLNLFGAGGNTSFTSGRLEVFTISDPPPFVSSIIPYTTGPTNADSVSFAVAFSENVVNFNNASDVIVTHTGTASTGVSIFGSGKNYTVTVTGISGDGSFTLEVNSASDVQNSGGIAIVEAVTSAPVTLDHTAPDVSIGTPTGSPVNSAGTASFPVTVSGANTISLLDTSVTINHSGTTGGSVTVQNGATATPTIEISGVTGDGTYTINIEAGVAMDAATNASAAAGPSDAMTADNSAPSVSIGAPTGSPLNSYGTASFPVTITGADSISLSDFQVTINHTGTSGGTLNVADGTTATPTVTVSGVTGDGSYTITIAGTIASDDANNASAETGESDAVTVDNTSPNATQILPGTTGPTNADTVQFNVVFDGDVFNFDASDLIVSHTGTAHTGITVTGAIPYIATVSGISGNGSFTLKVNTLSDVRDNIGNGLASSVTSEAVVIDTIAPIVNIGTPTGSPVNSAGTVSFPVTVTGADTINLLPANVTLDQIGTSGGNISVLNGSSATPTVQVSGVSGDGSYAISLAQGIASDTADNVSALVGPSASVTVDNTLPSFSSLSVSPDEASPGEDVTISFFPNEPLAQDPVVTVNGNPATRTAKATGYTYAYTVQPTDVDGAASVVVSGADSAGNTGTLSSNLLLTILAGASVPLFVLPILLALGTAGLVSLRRRRPNT